ncbi:TPA: HNH endonuclease [Streptococcus suis]|nr:HNH endonuclease [Streptococcus suis]
MSHLKIKKMSRTKPSGRSSSVTNAFFNNIVPFRGEPTPAEYDNVKRIVGTYNGTDQFLCGYCGKSVATSWDHIYPLIKKKGPTGYIHELANLIPACQSCNSSKGNKDWCEFFETSKKFKGLSEEEKENRKKVIRQYIKFFGDPYKCNIDKLKKTEDYQEYLKLHNQIHELLKEATKLSDKISEELQEQFKKENN